MSQDNILVSFIGHKVSKLCWCTNRDGSLSLNEFISGGWDDTDSNLLCLWDVPSDQYDAGMTNEPVVVAKKEIDNGKFSFAREHLNSDQNYKNISPFSTQTSVDKYKYL